MLALPAQKPKALSRTGTVARGGRAIARNNNPAWARLALKGQTPASISRPTDASELEANRVADSVRHMPAAVAQRVPAGVVQRKCATCEAGGEPCPACEEEQQPVVVNRKPDGTSEGTTPGAFAGPLGGGAPLDAASRGFFEPRFGRGFGDVRVHADAEAASTSRGLQARAFTLGSHVVFAAGEYQPQTGSGRELLAHELTHVIQQQGSAPRVQRFAVPGVEPAPAGEGGVPPVFSPAPSPPRRPAAIPRPETCPPPPDMVCPPATTSPGAVTNELLFPQDSSALTSMQRAEIDGTAAAWHAMGGGVTVRVDGFASAEGDCPHNWNLSCRRAQAVAGELISPIDGSPGVPSTDLERFAQGESDTAGRALAPNRRATISVPLPPPPPAPPTPPPCVFPVLLGSARGCASGPDFGHNDYPPNTLSTSSDLTLTGWALAHTPPRPTRHLVTDTECELEMDGVLLALAGSAGHDAFARFAAGTGGTETHGNSSTLGALALASPSFLATIAAVRTDIETQLAAQAAGGALDPCALSVTPPPTSFSRADGMTLKAVIGGTQGEQLFATGFTGDVTLRTYTIDLQFLICDDFGVDESDLYAPGLFPFWVLQHERSPSAYAPFVNELDLTVSIHGTF